ncbi:MAG: type II toxin-antitoxin system RelE/ParE family toxin [Burkholderiaceae bacterium]|jgi:plasmid stabilization system protein ParE|nr:type II toxin-antitoxin system RelE/ParE family toxin [Burkholderiaceae bacterium]
MQLIVHPAARRELDAALEWSKATFGRRTAARMQRRFEQAGRMLMREPAIGTSASRGARKLPLSSFPFTLVYRVEGSVIHVLALMHQSREPGYWVDRT